MNKIEMANANKMITNGKAKLEKVKEELLKEYKEKAKYMNENKDFSKLEKSSVIRRKYDRNIEDFDNRIKFHKNTMRYTILDVISSTEKINAGIEKYIAATDSMATVRITLFNEQKDKINEEIANLIKQRDLYPEYNKLYTEEGKKEFAEINAKIKDKQNQIKEIDNEIFMYQDRDNLVKVYKDNLSLIANMKKLAKDNKIDLNDRSYGEGPVTPGASTPVTPGASTPATPGASTPATPSASTPAAPGASTPATPGTSTPAAPGASTPATPSASTPATPGTSTPATPGTGTPATPGTGTPATPGASTPSTPMKNIIEITVGGKKGVCLSYNGKKNHLEEYVSSKQLRKYVGKLNKDKKLACVKNVIGDRNMTPDLERQIESVVDFLDDSIIGSLFEMNLDEERDEPEIEAIRTAMGAYVQSTISRKPFPGVNIVYDRSDLAKINIPIVSKVFRGRFSRKQKDYINEMSEKTSNWTNHVGNYIKNPWMRYLADKKTLKMPQGATEHSDNQLLKRLRESGYQMSEDPDKHKTPEQIAQENARAEARRQAQQQNGGEGR